MLSAAFVVALGWFLRVLQRSGVDFRASGVDFGGFLKVRGPFLGSKALFFERCCALARLFLAKASDA